MEYRYDYESPIGILELGANDHAITRLSFKKKDETNPGTREEYSTNKIIEQCVEQLDDYFSGRNLRFDIDIAQPGTAFQQSVWSALCTISHGQTMSYLQLSKKIGNVKAIRAVGTANGRNNIAIIVPCHRVIGSSGDLVGYGGELWRKKWLLEHEAKFSHGVQTLF